MNAPLTTDECLSHLDHAGKVCPGCQEPVDAYGNTESAFKYCSFPDCGCNGERLCMAGEASERARSQNVEGMWSGKTFKQRKAVFSLLDSLNKEKSNG